jgi:RimJ/RimL family protein N-acetyltransferase
MTFAAALPIGELVHPSSPAPRPQRRRLTAARYELSPLDPERDVEDLYDVGHRDPGAEVLWTYMAYGPFETPDHMRDWMRAYVVSDDPLFFTVVERATGRRVGMCSFMSIVPEMRRLEIGHIWYAPHLQGTGISSEVAWMLLGEAFEVLGYRRVEWKCNALNERSRRAALKLGFRFEGLFQQHMIVKGRNRDSAWFAMLDHEWMAAKAALEARMRVGGGRLPPSHEASADRRSPGGGS